MPVRVTVRHDDLQVHEVTSELPGRPAQAGVGVARGPARDVAERGAVGVHRPGRGRVHHARAGASRARRSRRRRAAARDRHRGADLVAARRRRRRLLLLRAGRSRSLARLAGASCRAAGSPRGPRLERTEPVAVTPRPSPTPSVPRRTDSSGLAVGDVDAAADGDPASVRRHAGAQAQRHLEVRPRVRLQQLDAVARGEGRRSPQVGPAGTSRPGSPGRSTSTATPTTSVRRRTARCCRNVAPTPCRRYLQSQLAGADVSIVSVGHGEADPVASNATPDGRKSEPPGDDHAASQLTGDFLRVG